MRGIGSTWRFLIAKIVPFPISKMSAMASIYNIFNLDLLQNGYSDREDISSEAMGRQGNFKLLNSFCSDFQAGRHGGHFEILQTTSPPEALEYPLHVFVEHIFGLKKCLIWSYATAQSVKFFIQDIGM